ncbi:MAG: M16 family metallopeptidase [Rhodothermaceae bacterium]
MPEINKSVLPGGIKVVSEYVPFFQSFTLGFWFDTGSVNETRANNGISHFIEHMLFKGTTSRSAKKIADDIESLGGYLNAFTSKEHTCYYGRGLANHFDKTYEVLSDMILNSVFNKDEIKREAQVILDEFYDIEDTAEDLIFEKFEMEVFKGNKLGYPVIGTEKTIQSFTQDDIVNYISKNYAANNLTIVSSGPLKHEKLVELTEKYFAGFNRKIKSRSKQVKLQQANDVIIDKDIQQTHLIYGCPTYGIKDENKTAVSVLSHILGEGSSSRLFQVLREKNGIAYQINTFYNLFWEAGTFGTYLSTNNESFDKALKLIDKEFEKIKNKKVTKKELKRAQEYLIGNMILALESTTDRMNRIAQSEIYLDRHKSVEETVDEILSVNVDDIMNIAGEVLDKEKLVKIIIAEKEEQ